MKKIILLVTAMIVLGLVNFLIFKKEETLAKGHTMLLELAPVDPRSLMQGDYMILRYAIANMNIGNLENSGCIVVTLDKNEVASFVRIHQNEILKPEEHLLFYRNRNGLRLGAESFFFQEGDADLYSKAKYGELKVDKTGQSVLVGLRNDQFTQLKK